MKLKKMFLGLAATCLFAIPSVLSYIINIDNQKRGLLWELVSDYQTYCFKKI